MSLDGLPPLRDVIAKHELSAKKALGQNFLLDLNITSKIARAAGDLSTHDILEVGPGPGGLTRALLMEGARNVVAVERDPRCLPALAEVAAHYPGKLTVIEGDALKTDLTPHLTAPVRIIANLPYNVGTELLVRWIEGPAFWDTLTLMFQKEVADRIIAAPGTNAYGRLAILTQWSCDARRVFDLPPSAFTPPPKVTSSVVHLTRLPAPRYPANARTLAQLTAAGFNQRRKMLRSSLKGLHPDMEALLTTAGIPPTERAERVSLEGFCALARTLDAAREAG